jgi:hypothetical protein
LNQTEVQFEPARSARAGLALFAIGVILLLLSRYLTPFAVIFYLIRLVSGSENLLQGTLGGLVSYIAAYSIPMALIISGTIRYYRSGKYPLIVDSETVITCISNDQFFPGQVYSYLLSEIERHAQMIEGRGIRLKPELIKQVPTDNEILIDRSTQLPNGLIKWILQSLLKQDPVKYKGYGVIEFGGHYTIGRLLDASQMEMYSCEICGYFTPYEEEIYGHRLTHFTIYT